MIPSNPIKILQVNDISGVARNLVKGFQHIGDKVQLFEPVKNIPYRKEFSPSILLMKRFSDSLKLSKIIRNQEIDIVHVHYAYIAALVWLSGHDYFLHCHGADVTRNLYDWKYKAITRKSILKAKKVFYSTPDLKSHLETIRHDAIFIPNPIDTESFDSSELKEESSNAIQIYVASKLEFKKGVEIAIEGVEKALEHEKVKVVFRTHGIDHEPLKERIKKLPGNIIYLQECSLPELIGWIRNSDIIIGQLKSGALGMTELEAMSCGKPVIAKFNYDQFYKFPPPIMRAANADEVKENILILIRDKNKRKSLGKDGRNWIMANHDYVKIAQRLKYYYKKA